MTKYSTSKHIKRHFVQHVGLPFYIQGKKENHCCKALCSIPITLRVKQSHTHLNPSRPAAEERRALCSHHVDENGELTFLSGGEWLRPWTKRSTVVIFRCRWARYYKTPGPNSIEQNMKLNKRWKTNCNAAMKRPTGTWQFRICRALRFTLFSLIFCFLLSDYTT